MITREVLTALPTNKLHCSEHFGIIIFGSKRTVAVLGIPRRHQNVFRNFNKIPGIPTLAATDSSCGLSRWDMHLFHTIAIPFPCVHSHTGSLPLVVPGNSLSRISHGYGVSYLKKTNIKHRSTSRLQDSKELFLTQSSYPQRSCPNQFAPRLLPGNHICHPSA